MSDDRANQFEQFKPILSEEEISNAAKDERVVLSFNGRSIINPETNQIDGFPIKFALLDGSSVVVIFDGYSFAKLQHLSAAVDAVNPELAAAAVAKKH